jgi:hypothetical protein
MMFSTKKKTSALIAIVFVATALVAQVEPASSGRDAGSTTREVRLVPVSRTDMSCSGFLAHSGVPHDHYVVGGWDTPNLVRYAAGDYVYVNGVLPDATEYSVVRELANIALSLRLVSLTRKLAVSKLWPRTTRAASPMWNPRARSCFPGTL